MFSCTSVCAQVQVGAADAADASEQPIAVQRAWLMKIVDGEPTTETQVEDQAGGPIRDGDW